MANELNCLQFCNATVADYGEMVNNTNGVRCPCLNCFGLKPSSCDTVQLSAELQIELQHLQRIRCSKCKHYNGK
jgi:hypothetical protein